MKLHRYVLSALALAALAGCATQAPPSAAPEVQKLGDPAEQKPPLTVIRTAATHDYRYMIYGDPLVAPAQAFSDAQHLYLQLGPEQVPPLAYTRSGDLIEYEVHRSIMRLPKTDSVVLRMGPRRAYVDHKEARIVPAQAPIPTEVNIEVKVERATQFALDFNADAAEVLTRTRGWRSADLCYAPVIAAHRAAQRYAAMLRAAGVAVGLRQGCADESVVQFKGELG